MPSSWIVPNEFEGQVAVVTGAGTGNGEAIAKRLYAGGAAVALLSHHLSSLQEVCERIEPMRQRTFPIGWQAHIQYSGLQQEKK